MAGLGAVFITPFLFRSVTKVGKRRAKKYNRENPQVYPKKRMRPRILMFSPHNLRIMASEVFYSSPFARKLYLCVSQNLRGLKLLQPKSFCILRPLINAVTGVTQDLAITTTVLDNTPYRLHSFKIIPRSDEKTCSFMTINPIVLKHPLAKGIARKCVLKLSFIMYEFM